VQKATLRKSLSEELKDALTLSDILSTLFEFVKICQKLDNQIRSHKAEKQGFVNRSIYNHTTKGPATQPHPTNSNSGHYDSAINELGAARYTRLIPELRTSLLQDNKCHCCRKVSHFVRDCQEKRATENRNSIVHTVAATVITSTPKIPGQRINCGNPASPISLSCSSTNILPKFCISGIALQDIKIKETSMDGRYLVVSCNLAFGNNKNPNLSPNRLWSNGLCICRRNLCHY
jgi:hypothetical protein